jgi:acyl-CoA synthetase (NDP forming)
MVLDPQTHVIGIHMESIAGDPSEFTALIKEAVALGKRVVILKSGRTEEGAKAAASHTGAMVRGSDMVFDSVLRQCGAIRVNTIEEFFDLARAIERFGSLSLKGNRIALVAMSGGEGVILTDLIQQAGLKMAKVTAVTLERLKSIFPSWEIGANPFYLGISLQFNDAIKIYETLIPALSQDENVDVLHVQIPDRIMHLPKERFSVFNSVPALKKPLVLWSVGAKPGSHETLQWLEEHAIPVFASPEKAIRAVAALWRLSSQEDASLKTFIGSDL